MNRRFTRSFPARLSAAVLTLSLVVFALSAYTAYRAAAGALRERLVAQLNADVTEQAQRATEWLARQHAGLQLVRRTLTTSPDELGPDTAGLVVDSALLAYEELQLIRVPGGMVERSTRPASIGTFTVDEEFYVRGRVSTYTQRIYLSASTGRPRLTIATPIDRNGATGVLAAHLDLSRMEKAVGHPSTASLPVDAYLVNRFAEFVSAERFGREGILRGVHHFAVREALAGRDGAGLYTNYDGVPVIGAWRWLPELELALIVESPQSAAFAPARRLVTQTLLLGIVSTILLTLGVTTITRRFTAPVLSVANAATRVAGGDFSVRTDVRGDDEVAQLAESFNVMTGQLDTLYRRLESQVDATHAALVEAQSSRTLLQDLMNNTAMLVLVVDLDGSVRLLNARAASMSGLPVTAATGRTVHELFGEEGASIERLVARARETDNIVEQEVAIELPGGPRDWQMVAFPLEQADGLPYAVGVIGTDLTERSRAEEERRARDASVQQAQKLESLGVMAGGIAHDFNNILGAIIGNAELARETVASGSEAAVALDRINGASRRAAELTRQMLAYAGRASLRREVIDARRVITDILPIVQASQSKKVQLQVASLPEPLWVELDPSQLTQVLLNLLTNAAEAIGERSGTVQLYASGQASPAGILPGDPPPHGWLRLTVEDDGPGIPQEVRARIFDPFFTTKASGRGLGLSAVRGIVGTVNGVLELSTSHERGTRFDIYLPRAVPPVDSPTGLAAHPSARASGTLLVVDDEAPIRDVVARVGRRMGLRIIEAGDGAEGLAQFLAHQHEIATILLDLTMPGMGGAEVLAAVRETHPTLPVVVASGYDRDDALPTIDDDRYTRFLAKPFGADTLRQYLAEALAQATSASSS